MKKIYSFMSPTMTENERPFVYHVVADSFENAIKIARSEDIMFTNVTEGPECIIFE